MHGPIEDTRYELTVSASSAGVLLALTDFGPMRPQIWPETSHPRVYRIHEVGEGDANALPACRDSRLVALPRDEPPLRSIGEPPS